MKRIMAALMGLVVFTGVAMANDYDVVILNGRVVDPETSFDGIRNVGVTDGKIVTITKKEITGKETIDANGLVVAPGFIDTQTHSAGSLWGVRGRVDRFHHIISKNQTVTMSLYNALPHAATTCYTRPFLVNDETKPLTEPCLRY